jgi:hypothetical protein
MTELTTKERRAAAVAMADALSATEAGKPIVVSVLIHSSTVETMTASAAQLKHNQPGLFQARKQKR